MLLQNQRSGLCHFLPYFHSVTDEKFLLQFLDAFLVNHIFPTSRKIIKH